MPVMSVEGSSKAQPATAGSSKAPLLPPLQPATAVLVVGMAGSGKSTFAARLAKEVDEKAKNKMKAAEGAAGEGTTGGGAYFLNLDPAVSNLAYPPNVDIRDTIDYSQVMSQYNLGPNGGILTSLNLFTTKFDQVLSILEQRAASVDTIVIDTPGQIEIFTWSASGTLITSSLLSSSIPTVVAYIIDTPRTTSPATFMSNMLYACSIMYKTKLPFILVFNKTDQQDWAYAKEWMEDFENFQKALKIAGKPTRSAVPLKGEQMPRRTGVEEDDGNFMNSLMNSMALVLDEFYANLNVSDHNTSRAFMSCSIDASARDCSPSACPQSQAPASKTFSRQSSPHGKSS